MELDREEIQRELEKRGMPKIYAFMAAQRAVFPWKMCLPEFGEESGKYVLRALFVWSDTPEGHDFWQGIAEDLERTARTHIPPM